MLNLVDDQQGVEIDDPEIDDPEIDEREIVEFEGFEPRVTFGRVLLGIFVLGSFAVWVYAYSGLADRVAPDTLDDSSFAVVAEEICVRAVDDIDQMPNALDAIDGPDRANQIRMINERYSLMLDELGEELGRDQQRSERDTGIIQLWLDRWRVIVSDRQSYADRLEADPNALFYLSADAGRRAERSLSYVADTNAMSSCGAPGDLG